jgi:NAD(P)-dependent dehydrogenase (short-subunit alcohol dehydrogenase family)
MDTDQLGGLPALLRDQIRGSIPGGRWVDPASVARAIYWLASDAGPEVSGCNVALASAMAI